MKSVCLQTRHCTESHTAENLKSVHESAFHEWKIKDKSITGCVDNARNIVNAWGLMEKTCMFCFGHTMNLAVKKGLAVPEIKQIIAKCRRLVGFFNHSPLADTALKAKQTQFGLPKKSLKQDVETRWNSTYDIITSIIENEEAVSAVLRADTKHKNLNITPEMIAILREIQVVLAPWKKLTVLMSADRYATLSLVAPSIHKLKTKHFKSIKILILSRFYE